MPLDDLLGLRIDVDADPPACAAAAIPRDGARETAPSLAQRPQALHERRVGRLAQAALLRRHDRRQVSAQQDVHRQAEPGEDSAPHHAGCIRRPRPVDAAGQLEPVEAAPPSDMETTVSG